MGNKPTSDSEEPEADPSGPAVAELPDGPSLGGSDLHALPSTRAPAGVTSRNKIAGSGGSHSQRRSLSTTSRQRGSTATTSSPSSAASSSAPSLAPAASSPQGLASAATTLGFSPPQPMDTTVRKRVAFSSRSHLAAVATGTALKRGPSVELIGEIPSSDAQESEVDSASDDVVIISPPAKLAAVLLSSDEILVTRPTSQNAVSTAQPAPAKPRASSSRSPRAAQALAQKAAKQAQKPQQQPQHQLRREVVLVDPDETDFVAPEMPLRQTLRHQSQPSSPLSAPSVAPASAQMVAKSFFSASPTIAAQTAPIAATATPAALENLSSAAAAAAASAAAAAAAATTAAPAAAAPAAVPPLFLAVGAGTNSSSSAASPMQRASPSKSSGQKRKEQQPSRPPADGRQSHAMPPPLPPSPGAGADASGSRDPKSEELQARLLQRLEEVARSSRHARALFEQLTTYQKVNRFLQDTNDAIKRQNQLREDELGIPHRAFPLHKLSDHRVQTAIPVEMGAVVYSQPNDTVTIATSASTTPASSAKKQIRVKKEKAGADFVPILSSALQAHDDDFAPALTKEPKTKTLERPISEPLGDSCLGLGSSPDGDSEEEAEAAEDSESRDDGDAASVSDTLSVSSLELLERSLPSYPYSTTPTPFETALPLPPTSAQSTSRSALALSSPGPVASASAVVAAGEKNTDPSIVVPRFRSYCTLGPDGRPLLDESLIQSLSVRATSKGASEKRAKEEDLSDERFLRRHHSLEIAERKRKQFGSYTTRFDYEQQQRLEKLREQESKARSRAASQSTSTLSVEDELEADEDFSFLPDIEDLRSPEGDYPHLRIQVAPRLPVLAFGCAIPRMTTFIPFTLPSKGPNACLPLGEHESGHESEGGSEGEWSKGNDQSLSPSRLRASNRSRRRPAKFVSE